MKTIVVVVLALCTASCGDSGDGRLPAAEGALAPHLSRTRGAAHASWLEPLDDGAHRLRFARFDGGWTQPKTIVEGRGFFANWADVPGVVEGGDGTLVAHWLRKLDSGTYAYGVEIATSEDEGQSWRPRGLLHDDDSSTEHGFVSWVATPTGARAFWLDGRRMVNEDGAMELRTTVLDAGGAAASVVLDDRVCECCSTGAAMTADGPVVVYRDRGDDELRDIRLIRREGDAWSGPIEVARDGWRISGCPVNGPAVATDGNAVSVAWFTAASNEAAVKLARSVDGGASFAEARVLDADQPVGRVDVAVDDSGRTWVSWMAKGGRIQVQELSPDGEPGPRTEVAQTLTQRASGFPRMSLWGSDLVFVWRKGARLHSTRIPTPRAPQAHAGSERFPSSHSMMRSFSSRG